MTTSQLQINQIRRQHVLGSTAIYRVCEILDQTIIVETISAPGLATGTHIRLTRKAVERMAAS
jgi:hypothetical protein